MAMTMVVAAAAVCFIASWRPDSAVSSTHTHIFTTHQTSVDLMRVQMGSLKLFSVKFIDQKNGV